jgi:SurA N-terminal domain
MAGFCKEHRRLKQATTLPIVILFCMAVGVCAAGAEPASSELPQGTVALVSHVPGAAGTVTYAELARAVLQASVQEEMSHPPRLGDPRYKQAAEDALRELLGAADIDGEAAARHLVVTQPEVSARLAMIKHESFKSEAEYRHYLRQAKLTEKEARERVKLQILASGIEARVIKGILGRAAQVRALRKFISNYARRWRSRTVCAVQFVIDRCSNGPPIGTEQFVAG